MARSPTPPLPPPPPPRRNDGASDAGRERTDRQRQQNDYLERHNEILEQVIRKYEALNRALGAREHPEAIPDIRANPAVPPVPGELLGSPLGRKTQLSPLGLAPRTRLAPPGAVPAAAPPPPPVPPPKGPPPLPPRAPSVPLPPLPPPVPAAARIPTAQAVPLGVPLAAPPLRGVPLPPPVPAVPLRPPPQPPRRRGRPAAKGSPKGHGPAGHPHGPGLAQLGAAWARAAWAIPGGSVLGAAGNVFHAATGSGAAGAAHVLGGMGAGAAAGPLGAIVAALPAAIDELGKLKSVIVEMGSKASPGALIRWNLALDSTQATIGRLFVPALEAMTDGLRLAGDFLHTVLPSRAEMDEAFAPFREALREMRPALAELAPLLRELAREELRELAASLAVVLESARPLIKLLQFGANPFGVFGKAEDLKGMGPPPRQARYQDIGGFIREQQASALTQSMGGGKRPEDVTAGNTTQMVKQLADVVRLLSQPAGRGAVVDDARGQAAAGAARVAIAVNDAIRWFRGG